jgi:threonine dehydrogenase-like Zn-dependent dehydrogenase
VPTTVITQATPVAFSDRLPGAVDVVVIGAGIVGISTAYFLRAVLPKLGLGAPAGP